MRIMGRTHNKTGYGRRAECATVKRSRIYIMEDKVMDKLELAKKANEVRKGIVTAVHSAKAGHPGGSLSAADMFTSILF